MNCTSCSKQIPAYSRFCLYCGADQASARSGHIASSTPEPDTPPAARQSFTSDPRAMRLVTVGEAVVIAVLILLLAMSLGRTANGTPAGTPVAVASTTPASPYPPPVAIKTVAAHQQDPDDFVLYLELADQNGQITRADGSAVVQIVGPDGKPVFSLTRNINTVNFVDILVGSGASAHYETIYSFGLVKYEDLGDNPSGKTYTLHATFDLSGGKTLSRDTTITLQ